MPQLRGNEPILGLNTLLPMKQGTNILGVNTLEDPKYEETEGNKCGKW
jgi:hypothetical protein